MIVVRRPGPLTTVQDLGRLGLAHLGVPRAGAVDERSLRRANALVGNPPEAAALEATLVGPELEVRAPVRLAVVGVNRSEVIDAAAGDVVAVGSVRAGVRVYVAVTGGFGVAPVLGSRSTDTLSGLGPAVVQAGDVLPVGRLTGPAEEPPEMLVGVRDPVLHMQFGPRNDWFTDEALVLLQTALWRVTPRSDRTGVRFDGPPLARWSDRELPSEGMLAGAVQVPPDGQPILFLSNGPTTGGYPVIAVVRAADLPLAAQLRPGAPVRFLVDGERLDM